MSWKKTLFGSDDPSRFVVASVLALLAATVLFAHGWYADFVPSAAMTQGAFWFGPALAVVLWAALYWADRRDLVSVLGFQMLLGPPLFAALATVGLVHGAADLVTAVAGKPSSLELKLAKERASTSRCSRRLVGDPVHRAYPGHLCISASAWERAGDPAHVILEGKETILGFRVESYRLVPPSAPKNPKPKPKPEP